MKTKTLNLLLHFSWLLPALGYVPAVPSNDSAIINQPINQSDTSLLQLHWFPNASFGETASFQLAGVNGSGISKGALVHFSEQDLAQDTGFTTTPWIAFVSCDSNITNELIEQDIFFLAANRGAVGALLYSQWSDACILNAEYINPAVFKPIIDIFTTKSLISARTVVNAFTNFNEGAFGNFNSTMLNQSSGTVSQFLSSEDGSVSVSSYLLAELIGESNHTSPNATSPGANNNGAPSDAGVATVLATATFAFYVLMEVVESVL